MMMKSFQTLAAFSFLALAVNGSALHKSSTIPSTVAVPTGVPSSSTLDSPPTSTTPCSSTGGGVEPTGTGGYVVTGIYTTCLTVTFAAPTHWQSPTPPTSDAPASLPSGVTPGGPIISAPSDTALPSGVTPSAPWPVVSASASASAVSPSAPFSASASAPVVTPTPPPVVTPDAVFTTCLVFLPSATVSTTYTTSGDWAPTASASANGGVPSVTGSAPVASGSVVPSGGL
ncbi:hypothetical protein C8R46DRAFT_95178 [Mycena filopes]|nr:hypothetical protein C8R46DRAFT_95178 [Mycena filopes]